MKLYILSNFINTVLSYSQYGNLKLLKSCRYSFINKYPNAYYGLDNVLY